MTVYILMQDGTLPAEEVISGLQDFLQDREIRPMTDKVEVLPPEVRSFDLDLAYTIDRSNQSQADMIQQKVEAAVNDYVQWQTTQIGRDIDPSELIRRVREAGAKNPVVASPTFTPIMETEVAQLGERKVAYGGLQDD